MVHDNKLIWEHRYANNKGIARWPYDKVVSMIMRRFAMASDRSKVSILDYGCGGGNNFWFLAREGFQAHACDVSRQALKYTQNRMIQEGIGLPDDRYSLLESNYLLYSDNFFHAIVDRESLCQSNWPNVQARVREFRRILQPGGWYLGINFSDHHPDLRHSNAIGCGDYRDFSQGLFKNQGQRHLFSVNEITDLFSEGWYIENLAELRVSSIIGDGASIDTSEYLIAAQKIN